MIYRKIKKSDLFLIAGPCVIESKDNLFEIAEHLKMLSEKYEFTLIFKASFLKANRTSIDSFSGPGLEKGLQMLSDVKKEFELPILTDIHQTNEVDAVAEVADILQIPAFLSRQTFLLTTAAKTGKIVNIKKAQFMAPEDMEEAVNKVTSFGNNNVLVTERGTSFGYHNLVVDFRSFLKMKNLGFPVLYDVTHSLQQPSIGKISGGTPQYAYKMARAAIATGSVDGLFVETHPNPAKALSDAKSMLPLAQMEKFISGCVNLKKWMDENA